MRLKPSDLEKLGIADMPELRAEQWDNMYVSEKVEVLQECERRISQHEGRESVDVLAVNMADLSQKHEQCWGCDAGFFVQKHGNEMVLDDQFLSSATPYEAFEKYSHEAAHAYQLHAMENPGFHPNEYEVTEWQEARVEYSKEGVKGMTMEEYSRNPLEVDARYFSESCSHELEQTHEVQRAQEELALELPDQNSQQMTQDSSSEPQQTLDTQERER